MKKGDTRRGDIRRMYFPRGYVFKENQKVMDLANMIGRKTVGVDDYKWDDPEYVILEAGIDDEMAEMALAMGYFTKRTAKEMSKIIRKPEEYCHKQMMKLAEYGTTFVNTIDGVDVFWHAESWIPGVMEMIVNNLENVKKYPVVSYAMEAYGRLRGPLSAGLFPPGIGLMRVIPIESSVDAKTKHVKYESIEKYLNENNIFSCSACSCRTNREEMGEGCGHLKEDMCIQMGHAAEYYIRTGRAREITREEAFEIIKRAEDNGLMHSIPNIDGHGKTHAICNCCGCGCLSLRTGLMYKNVDMTRSNFIAKPNRDKCTACGQCVEYCPMNALRLGQKLPSKSLVVNDITTTRTPRNTEWTQLDWDPAYRTNRREVVGSGTSPCKTSCPAHIGVQGYIKLAAQGKYREALELIKKENPFPAVCGFICNHRCEDECTRCNVDDPVAIDEIKKFIAMQDLKSETRFVPKVRHNYSDKKIAIIGSGPAGLTCAYFLALDGYDITVFEKEKRLGGMLTMGVPSFVLDKEIVNAEINVLKELGVKFKTGIEIGKDTTLDNLRKEGYMAFYLAVGAQKGRKLGVEGEDNESVISGIDFLRKTNLGEPQNISGKVIVIGGGNVAIDVARVAAQSKDTNVSLYCLETLEEMPAHPSEIKIAQDEGISINNSWGPKRIITENGKVTGIEFIRGEAAFNLNGELRPRYDDSITETVDCDYVLLAIGQEIDWCGMLEGSEAVLDSANRIQVDKLTYQSEQPDVFAGGDAVTGPKFAIDAIAAGKQAAISIHRFVQPGQSLIFGRSKRVFTRLMKATVIIEGYDNTPRQRTEKPSDILTQEQIKKETERCLGCGTTNVDEYMCVGCGMCVTKCKFEAMTLKRAYRGKGVKFLDIKKTIIPHIIKRKIKIKIRQMLGFH